MKELYLFIKHEHVDSHSLFFLDLVFFPETQETRHSRPRTTAGLQIGKGYGMTTTVVSVFVTKEYDWISWVWESERSSSLFIVIGIRDLRWRLRRGSLNLTSWKSWTDVFNGETLWNSFDEKLKRYTSFLRMAMGCSTKKTTSLFREKGYRYKVFRAWTEIGLELSFIAHY